MIFVSVMNLKTIFQLLLFLDINTKQTTVMLNQCFFLSVYVVYVIKGSFVIDIRYHISRLRMPDAIDLYVTVNLRKSTVNLGAGSFL